MKILIGNKNVDVKKRGVYYYGLCPEHKEKTPSFSVDLKGQKYKCFGCGIEGEIPKVIIVKKKFVYIDNEYFEILSKFSWFFVDGYVCTNLNIGGKIEKVFLHRMITGAPQNKYIDHINNNKLDNRLCNLRYCTNGENVKNNLRSRYKGVHFHRASGLWRSKIKYMNEWLELGYYKTEDEAAEAFNRAVDFYKLNREKNII